ncbi:MAG: pyridoxamine 5'-phosphate oxidase family protein [Sporomusaceae bacterium]|nr:pyridoxamine 5'-phosphate oxidase family protein [Sporomusaceae bacterium]
MYEQQVIDLVKSEIAFVGTVEDNRPHVRPMYPYIDKDGHIWLFNSCETRQFSEIEKNPRVELCVYGKNGELVNIYGRLHAQLGIQKELAVQKEIIFREVPALQKYFTGPDDPKLVYYRLGIHEIRYVQDHHTATTRVNLPQEYDPDIEMALCQGGFCLVE